MAFPFLTVKLSQTIRSPPSKAPSSNRRVALLETEMSMTRGTEDVATVTPPGGAANPPEAVGETAEKRPGNVAEAEAILAFVMPTPTRICNPRRA